MPMLLYNFDSFIVKRLVRPAEPIDNGEEIIVM